MDSALSYIQSLVVDTLDKAGKDQNKKDKKSTSCQEVRVVPECSVPTQNACTANKGKVKPKLKPKDVERQDKGKDNFSTFNIHPSLWGKKNSKKVPTFAGLVKSKSLEMASRISLFQSFSDTTTSHNTNTSTPYDMEKAGSNISKTTVPDDDSDNSSDTVSWAKALSSSTSEDGCWADNNNNNGPNHKPGRKTRDHQRGRRGRERGRGRRLRPRLPPPSSKEHIEWCSHGTLWTCMALAFAWCGVGLSYMARQSTDFVSLNQPMYLDPRYETIPAFGMIKLELCWNATHLEVLDELRDDGGELNHKERRRTGELVEYERNNVVPVSTVLDEDRVLDCMVHRLTSDDIHDDTMYTVSQAVAFLSMVMGGFVTICLTASIFWKSINLRPIGAGYLVAYFLQSFTFLVFDSDLCGDHQGCTLSGGGILSAIASVCWIVSCAASARMEKRKLKTEQLREQQEQQHELQKSASPRRRVMFLPEPGDTLNRDTAAAASPRGAKSSEPKPTKTKSKGTEQQPPSHRSLTTRLSKPKAMKASDRAQTSETVISCDDDDYDYDEPTNVEASTPSSRSLLTLALPPPPPPPGRPRRSRERSKSRTRPHTKLTSPERAKSPQRASLSPNSACGAPTMKQREDPSGKVAATSSRNLELEAPSPSPSPSPRQRARSKGRKPALTVDVTIDEYSVPEQHSSPTSDSSRRKRTKPMKTPSSYIPTPPPISKRHEEEDQSTIEGEPRRGRKTVFDFANPSLPDAGCDSESDPEFPDTITESLKPKQNRSSSRSRSQSATRPGTSRSRSQSTTRRGTSRSRSQSTTRQGTSRSRSQSTTRQSTSRSRSQSTTRQSTSRSRSQSTTRLGTSRSRSQSTTRQGGEGKKRSTGIRRGNRRGVADDKHYEL
eukprot:jgi/Psemu1/325710/estExt_fgenesh1_pg.C_2710011